jgi:putative two-component system response regulator
VKTHTTLGARMLDGGSSELMQVARTIALAHHERWDGTGYPAGLRGEEIPLPARIVALADFVDALGHDRPYRSAWSRERLHAEIRRQSGAHFDPAVVEAFFATD